MWGVYYKYFNFDILSKQTFLFIDESTEQWLFSFEEIGVLTVLLPLLIFFIIGLFGYKLGKKGCTFVTVVTMFLSLCSSIYTCIFIYKNGSFTLNLFPWIKIGLLNITWSLLFDELAVFMILVVTIVSFFVHCYSFVYMWDDPHLPRFIAYLSLFTFFMLCLVTSNNFLQFFFGWEGIGISSFLLINFWFTRIQANKAALKALLVNRVGDLSYIAGASFCFWLTQSLEFDVVFDALEGFQNTSILFLGYKFNVISLICTLFFLSVMGKSAQFGFHIWLPDAMEGPTPVSSLIHAATLVTAGVFLLIRFSPMYYLDYCTVVFITLIGAITAVYSAFTGLLQTDIKKIIAYSTCSQLGYMVFMCGLGAYEASYFHLCTHAFFKALLFLAAGSVIHNMHSQQDIRKFGGLRYFLPITYITFFLASLALIGFPYFSGFYSKDFIFEYTYISHRRLNILCYNIGLITAIFTALYSCRLIYLIFWTTYSGPLVNVLRVSIKENIHLSYWVLIPLSLLSVISGFVFKSFFTDIGQSTFEDLPYQADVNEIEADFIPYFIKIVPTITTILFFIIGWWWNSESKSIFISNFYSFFNMRLYVDYCINFLLKTIFPFIFNIFIKVFDKGFLEVFGPYGITYKMYKLCTFQNSWNTGSLFQYICLLLLFIIGFLILILFIF